MGEDGRREGAGDEEVASDGSGSWGNRRGSATRTHDPERAARTFKQLVPGRFLREESNQSLHLLSALDSPRRFLCVLVVSLPLPACDRLWIGEEHVVLDLLGGEGRNGVQSTVGRSGKLDYEPIEVFRLDLRREGSGRLASSGITRRTPSGTLIAQRLRSESRLAVSQSQELFPVVPVTARIPVGGRYLLGTGHGKLTRPRSEWEEETYDGGPALTFSLSLSFCAARSPSDSGSGDESPADDDFDDSLEEEAGGGGALLLCLCSFVPFAMPSSCRVAAHRTQKKKMAAKWRRETWQLDGPTRPPGLAFFVVRKARWHPSFLVV